jgi:hypothetical protein
MVATRRGVDVYGKQSPKTKAFRALAGGREGPFWEPNLPDIVADSSFTLKECDVTEHRRREKQTRSLEERMAEQAAKLKALAAQLPAGAERERLLRKARLAETGARLSDWVTSPGLLPPD